MYFFIEKCTFAFGVIVFIDLLLNLLWRTWPLLLLLFFPRDIVLVYELINLLDFLIKDLLLGFLCYCLFDLLDQLQNCTFIIELEIYNLLFNITDVWHNLLLKILKFIKFDKSLKVPPYALKIIFTCCSSYLNLKQLNFFWYNL